MPPIMALCFLVSIDREQHDPACTAATAAGATGEELVMKTRFELGLHADVPDKRDRQWGALIDSAPDDLERPRRAP